MSPTKVDFLMDDALLQRVDYLVKIGSFQSRTAAVLEAVSEKIARLDTSALATECAKLDPKVEQELADESLTADLASWPKY